MYDLVLTGHKKDSGLLKGISAEAIPRIGESIYIPPCEEKNTPNNWFYDKDYTVYKVTHNISSEGKSLESQIIVEASLTLKN